MTIKKDEQILPSPEEIALLNRKRKEQAIAQQCATEIAAVLKKYNMRLETTKPEVLVVPNINA